MAVKIIGGDFKGRVMQTPEGLTTRPTGVLARKMLFDMLLTDKKWGRDLSGVRVMDICAGVGLLGLEALSRGAEKILFIERDDEAITAIKKNVATLRAESKVVILAQKIPAAFQAFDNIAKEFKPSEIIFADPPYERDDLRTALIDGVVTHQLLARGGFFLLQTKPTFDMTTIITPTSDLKIIDDRRAGNARVWFLQWA